MQLYASDFAKRNGYPLSTIKRLCKNGQLPYIPVGRKYLMDEEECKLTIQRLKERPPMYRASPEPVVRSSRPRQSRYMKKVFTTTNSTGSFVGQLDDLIRK